MDRLRQLIAESLQIDADRLSDDLGFNSAPNWDSLNHINLMLLLEDTFELTISDEELVSLTTVGAIREFLARSGSSV